MKRWQPINCVPLDTEVVVTDGRTRRIAVLTSQKPVWKFEEHKPVQNYAAAAFQQGCSSFTPTHWFLLPKLAVE